jgi:hypothetical protein
VARGVPVGDVVGVGVGVTLVTTFNAATNSPGARTRNTIAMMASVHKNAEQPSRMGRRERRG